MPSLNLLLRCLALIAMFGVACTSDDLIPSGESSGSSIGPSDTTNVSTPTSGEELTTGDSSVTDTEDATSEDTTSNGGSDGMTGGNSTGEDNCKPLNCEEFLPENLQAGGANIRCDDGLQVGEYVAVTMEKLLASQPNVAECYEADAQGNPTAFGDWLYFNTPVAHLTPSEEQMTDCLEPHFSLPSPMVILTQPSGQLDGEFTANQKKVNVAEYCLSGAETQKSELHVTYGRVYNNDPQLPMQPGSFLEEARIICNDDVSILNFEGGWADFENNCHTNSGIGGQIFLQADFNTDGMPGDELRLLTQHVFYGDKQVWRAGNFDTVTWTKQ